MTISDLALAALQEGGWATFIDRPTKVEKPIPVGACLLEIQSTLGIPVERLDVFDIGPLGFYVEVMPA